MELLFVENDKKIISSMSQNRIRAERTHMIGICRLFVEREEFWAPADEKPVEDVTEWNWVAEEIKKI